MKLNISVKFWLVFSCIVIAALLGGVLGNWAFIYMLDKYYGIPGGNYLAVSTNSPVIVRDAKKVIVEQDNRIAQSIESADAEFVRIFKRQADNAIYQKKDALFTAVIATSDGWLVTGSIVPTDKETWKNYEAVTPDRRRFEIETVKVDTLTGLSYIRLLRAQNLPVRNLISKADLTIGQTMIALSNDGAVEVGRLSREADAIISSDAHIAHLAVSDIAGRDGYIFDAAGQMVAVVKSKNVLAMDAVQQSLEKLLTEGRIVRPRFGVHYLNLSKALAPGKDSGALVIASGKEPAVVVGSPAEKAGIKAGDIITAIDDTVINGFIDLASLVSEYSSGDAINVTLRRGQETKKFTVTLDTLVTK